MEATFGPSALEIDSLLTEIDRYLAVVETFRRLGCEPRWRQAWLVPPAAAVDSKEER